MANDGRKSKDASPFEEIELDQPAGIVNSSFEDTEIPENHVTSSTRQAVERGKDVENGNAAVVNKEFPPGKREVKLIYTQVEKLPLRDFYHEVRPMLDVEHYVFDMTVILDLDKMSTEDIVTELLSKIFPEKNLRETGIVDDCKRLLFTDSDNCMLADVLQGTAGTDTNPFTMDPNWLIAMCDLPMIKKTRLGIARLKDPVNFGPDAASVQFLCLIIGATEEVRDTTTRCIHCLTLRIHV